MPAAVRLLPPLALAAALACTAAEPPAASPRAVPPPEPSAPTATAASPPAPADAAPLPPAPASAPTPPAPTDVLRREDCLADLAELAQHVATDWSYAEDKREHFGVDLERLRAEAEQALGDRPTRAELAAVLRRFVAGLKDGHAGSRVPGVPAQGARVWPFTVADTSDGVIVDVVEEGTPAVERGQTVIAVDRQPIEAVIAAELAQVSASTDGARRSKALRSMRSTDEPLVRCVLQRPAGTFLELELETLPAESGPRPPERPPLESSHRRLEGDVGYLRVASFVAPDGQAWATATPAERPALIETLVASYRQAFADLADTRALILDLRGNAGGTDLAAMEVARPLLPPGAIYFQLSSRVDEGRWSAPSGHGLTAGPDVPRYERPLVVLIDEGTFSAADNLAACLADNLPSARFVGRPTGGGTGAPRVLDLPRTGAQVYFCTMQVRGPAGELTEGRGVLPDVPVRWSRDDILAGRDPDLAAALSLLGPAER